jgi:hypothetical protein
MTEIESLNNIEIDEDDNIFYYHIKEESDITNLMIVLRENAVQSLYIIEVARENLFDKTYFGLKSKDLYTKHKYSFINKNLPKIEKIVLHMSNYEDIKQFKLFCPLISNTSYSSKGKNGRFIIVLEAA